MQLKNLFDGWLTLAGKKYANKQWLLSKWEVCEGIEWPQEKIEVMHKTIRQGLDLQRTNSLIDLGCGGGWVLNNLRPYVKETVGLDFCWPMIENARATVPDSAFIQGAIGELPIKDGSFDRALCYFVMINMLDDGTVEKSILDILRIVKKGGKALVGQLPDKAGSKEYDKAKSDHLAFCEKHYKIGPSIRDDYYMPQKLFDVPRLKDFLDRQKISYRILPSFNPFYRPGQAETVSWRFDLVMDKP